MYNHDSEGELQGKEKVLAPVLQNHVEVGN